MKQILILLWIAVCATNVYAEGKGIGSFLLEKTKQRSASAPESIKCPDPKYCKLKPKEIAAFMQALDELGREQGPLVTKYFPRLNGGKQDYNKLVRRRLGVVDPEESLTARQITRTLGEALEAGELKHSPFMADVKINVPDWYEAFDKRFERIRGQLK